MKLFCTQGSDGKIDKQTYHGDHGCWKSSVTGKLSIIPFSFSSIIVNCKFSAKFRCCLFIASLRPDVPEFLRPRIPTSRRPRVPRPRVPRPRVPESPRPRVPAFPSPMSPRPRVPASHVPVPLLVTAVYNDENRKPH